MDFYSAYRHGFVRVAACTHHTTLADPAANGDSVLRLARACHDDNVALAIFPELTLSGYSIEDILLQDALLDSVEDALLDLVVASAELLPVLVIGAPLRYRHRIYNTAVVIHRGRVLGVAPKSYLPTYREFYERRQVAAGDDVRGAIRIGGEHMPFGPDLLFTATDLPGFVLHVEICEDMFVPVPPVHRPHLPVRRCWRTCPAARSRSDVPRTAACWPGRRRHGVWRPTCMPRRVRASRPLTWPGTARP
jgi:NAD+ synthase (glutamine-hydrolysing)